MPDSILDGNGLGNLMTVNADGPINVVAGTDSTAWDLQTLGYVNGVLTTVTYTNLGTVVKVLTLGYDGN